MTLHRVTRKELWLAEGVLFLAILLQIAVWAIGPELTAIQYIILTTEVALAVVIGFTSTRREVKQSPLHRPASLLLLALVSLANISSFVGVVYSLLTGHHLTGPELLISAVAVFLTNIIVFAVWYWELDSPGLSGSKWSQYSKDFQFTQQDMPEEFPSWQPGLIDYMYLSLTNAINFAPADTRPLTPQAKSLMGIQALVSIFALSLILARSITVLGQQI
jgi:uncharacterized membrane protein